ncbi:hypothetical protein [Nocardiopsis gilva]|nr:hypothetical protein [Nocardiopsis gilva]
MIAAGGTGTGAIAADAQDPGAFRNGTTAAVEIAVGALPERHYVHG